MNYTRKYYESFLDSMYNIVMLDLNDFDNLNKEKQKLNKLLADNEKYNILTFDTRKAILRELASSVKGKFLNRQSKLSEFLYNNLGKILFTFERTERTTDYATALEIYRTELPYDSVSKWKVLKNPRKEFSMEFLFFELNRKWTDIKTVSEYEKYKKEIRNRKSTLRYKGRDKKISKRKLDKLNKYYQRKFKENIEYIDKHYHSIKSEFSIYNSNVRIYIIDRNGVPGQSTKQTKTYKKLEPKNSCHVYPFLLNMATRFNNLEEIESSSLGYSESLFEINNIEKYDYDFNLINIHFELLYIFLKNCSEKQKIEFLIYLIKCNLSVRVLQTDKIDELKIDFEEKCKLFINNTPNLNAIRRSLDKNKYSFVAFTNRPDEETMEYLKQKSIESIIINDIARNYLNIRNSEIIHQFIKERINDLNIVSEFSNKSSELISRLKNCPEGIEGWAEFEEICTNIFQYLFEDNFRKYTHKTQAYTHDSIFRRDLIVNNNFNDSTSIWGQAKTDFNCNLIVIDFKNYSEPLKQNEFYLPSKYLNLKSGKFGILMTRKGLGNSAAILQKRMFNLDNELLMVLTENDLIQMIKEKSLDQDPSYRLENKKFKLFESI